MHRVDPYLKWACRKKIIVFVIYLPNRSLDIGGARYPMPFQRRYFSLKLLTIFSMNMVSV
ncbi:hypothetical protein LT40_15690 [Pseudomonas rhizosphaerae]|uniref:Uncharacterized protein n=1 Tax=Pseudomonas rhizosphaerae TaxID=216142 RepID=A0A089YQJ6_9PSED|nr:hypothetical protein LT40_15690 [Pseudomonas rhizosphaerae]